MHSHLYFCVTIVRKLTERRVIAYVRSVNLGGCVQVVFYGLLRIITYCYELIWMLMVK